MNGDEFDPRGNDNHELALQHIIKNVIDDKIATNK